LCRTASALAVIVRREERMETELASEAVEVRERLAGFVAEVAGRLPLRGSVRMRSCMCAA
jgi:hypothetical protein